MPDSLFAATNIETSLSRLQAGGQQEDSLLSTRESMGAGAWPWSTPSGIVWSNPPAASLRHVITWMSAPAWMSPAIARLRALLSLPPNWNSYGSMPIAPSTIHRALQFMVSALPSRAPTPAIVPTPSGGVQLEWHQDGLDVEIELLPDGIACSVGDQNGVDEFSLRTQLDLLRLRIHLARLH
jgi:hypothetical protein